ncbi:hypothetical protein ERUR111494_06375 [Erysipelothrix urinaevulpis]|uniref:hypothetical protein n=1 Tax=Erysipelothrix urinaevulpis TaxID=2683717 RepID=UPI001359DF0E|nr:hypothetical protein [Erysipelothrix urinaevulpis]
MNTKRMSNILTLANVIALLSLYSVYNAIITKPYRPVFILEYIKIMIVFTVLLLFFNGLVFVKTKQKNKGHGNKNRFGPLFMTVVLAGSLFYLGYHYQQFNVEVRPVIIDGFETFAYTNKKLNENGIFEVNFYLSNHENERYITTNPILTRYYQEQFLDSYFDEPQFFVSEIKRSWLALPKEDEKESQIPSINSYENDSLTNDSFKFIVETDHGKIGFKVLDRAMSAELIGAYQFDELNNEWVSIKTIEKTDEIHDVFMIDDLVFINYGSHHEKTMSLYRTDMSFERLERLEVPFVKPSDVYVHSIKKNNETLQMVAGSPKWDQGDTETIYESKDQGKTWVFIETRKI